MKDFLLYTAIGLAIVLAAVLFALHQVKIHGSPDLPLKWMGFAGMSAIVFGYAIRTNRASWRKPRFWRLLAAFSLVHFSLGFAVLSRIAAVPLIVYGALTGMEYLVLSIYIAFFLDRKADSPGEKP